MGKALNIFNHINIIIQYIVTNIPQGIIIWSIVLENNIYD